MNNAIELPDTPSAQLGGFSQRDIWTSGFEHARDIPTHNQEAINTDLDEEAAKKAAFEAWYEAEDNSRQYSPFEFTAKAINDMEDNDTGWEIFQDGINAAFELAWQNILRTHTFA